jgi:DNA primase
MVEHDVLAAVLQLPQLIPAEFDDLGGDVFQVPQLRAVHDAVRAAGGIRTAHAAGPAAWVSAVREMAPRPVAGVITALAVDALPVVPGGEEQYAKGVVNGLLLLNITRQLGGLRAKLGALEADGNSEEAQRVLAQINQLMRQREALRPD